QQFGTWPVLSDLVTAWGPMVVAISWGSILFQCAFPFMLFNRYTRIVALLGILSFHLGIALLMGLPWFSMTVIAVDAIFIRGRSFAKPSAYLRHWSAPSAPRPNAAQSGPPAAQGTRAARTPRSRAPETPTARRQATETPTARPATESSGCIPSSVSQVELSAEVPLHGAVGGGPASRGCRRGCRVTASGAAPGLWPRDPRAGRPRRCHRRRRHRPAARGPACRRSRAGPGDAAVGRR